jgi:two-component sensor histidine kinase
VTLCWTETGGPTIGAAPAAAGFGSQLMEMSAVRQLGGTVERDWRPEGLRVTIRVPQRSFSRG